MDGRQSKSWSTRRIEYHALDKQLEATEEQLHAWMQTAIQKNTKSSVCQVMCARPSFVLFSSSPPSPPPFFRFYSFTPFSLLMACCLGAVQDKPIGNCCGQQAPTAKCVWLHQATDLQ